MLSVRQRTSTPSERQVDAEINADDWNPATVLATRQWGRVVVTSALTATEPLLLPAGWWCKKCGEFTQVDDANVCKPCANARTVPPPVVLAGGLAGAVSVAGV